MQLILKGRNIDLSDRIHGYAEKRMSRLERFFDESRGMSVELELLEEKNPKIEERARANAHLRADGKHMFHAEGQSNDIYAVIDQVSDTLLKQVRREHERNVEERHGGKKSRRTADAFTNGGSRTTKLLDAVQKYDDIADVFDEEKVLMENQEIVVTKQYNYRPMGVEEAAEQMELLGHEFYLFHNAESDCPSVVYRKSNGDLGVVETAEFEEGRKGA